MGIYKNIPYEDLSCEVVAGVLRHPTYTYHTLFLSWFWFIVISVSLTELVMLLSCMPQVGHFKALNSVTDVVHLAATTELSAYLHLQTNPVMIVTQCCTSIVCSKLLLKLRVPELCPYSWQLAKSHLPMTLHCGFCRSKGTRTSCMFLAPTEFSLHLTALQTLCFELVWNKHWAL